MSDIFEQIKADREAGTPGDWGYQNAPFTSENAIGDEFWIYGPETAWGRNSFAELRYGCEEAQEDGDLEANARRIARVPKLEKIALEAEQMRIDLLIASNNIADAAKTDPRWSGVAAILRARLAKFDEATQ